MVTKTDFFSNNSILESSLSKTIGFFSFSYRVKLIAMVSTAKKAKFPYASKIETILLFIYDNLVKFFDPLFNFTLKLTNLLAELRSERKNGNMSK